MRLSAPLKFHCRLDWWITETRDILVKGGKKCCGRIFLHRFYSTCEGVLVEVNSVATKSLNNNSVFRQAQSIIYSLANWNVSMTAGRRYCMRSGRIFMTIRMSILQSAVVRTYRSLKHGGYAFIPCRVSSCYIYNKTEMSLWSRKVLSCTSVAQISNRGVSTVRNAVHHNCLTL